jgi:hypothetical protein
MQNIKYVVTGTGRCGTVYMAKFLTALGIPCGHESIFTYESEPTVVARLTKKIRPTVSDVSLIGGKLWTDLSCLRADSSYMALPYLETLASLKDVKVIHVVRNPLKVIASFVKKLDYFTEQSSEINQIYESWMIQQLPQINNYILPLDKIACFYTEWNRRIEALPHQKIFLRIEDKPDDSLFEFLGVQNKQVLLNKTENEIITKNVNLTLEEFNYPLIKIMKDYGYIN